jgi:hypothetical protein
LTWGPVALLVVVAGAFALGEAAFDDVALAGAEAAGAADVPDPADVLGIVVRPDRTGVVWNARTPTRPASVPPSTIGVRFIARSFAT